MKVYRGIILIVLVIFSLGSCRTADTLTEDEILAFDKQGWSYSIFLLDPYTDLGVGGITVEVTMGGELMSLTSNASGTVEFESGYHPEFAVSMVGPGYFSMTRKFNLSSEDEISRSKILNATFILFPDADYGTFTIQGKATVQSDLTTPEEEAAPGAQLTVEIGFAESSLLFPAVTDNGGNYSVRLPAWPNLSSFRFVYEAYVADQKIAINALSSQPAFPATLPTIMQIETSFDPTTAILPIPSVQPVYAIVPAPPAGPGALQADPFRITSFDGTGGITLSTFGLFPNIGAGYLTGDQTLTIVSIAGGSGATGVARDTGVDGILDQYQTTASGSGYPFDNSNINEVSIFGEGFSADFGNNTFNGPSSSYRPGAIIINDIYYGTGTSRDKVVN